jgi:hypothetical protein
MDHLIISDKISIINHEMIYSLFVTLSYETFVQKLWGGIMEFM